MDSSELCPRLQRIVAFQGFPGMELQLIVGLIDFFGQTIHGNDLQLMMKPWDSTSEVVVAGNLKFRLESARTHVAGLKIIGGAESEALALRIP